MSEVIKVRATKMVFERSYSDGDHLQSVVSLNEDRIEFESLDSHETCEFTSTANFPLSELEWLIAALTRIWLETSADRAAINKATQEPEP